MFRLNLMCLVALCTCSAREPPILTIPNQGQLQGMEMSLIRTQRIIAYLGIPYAHPPLNQLRFAPPQIDPIPSWEGVYDATKFKDPCLQTEKDYKQQEIPFLNLFSQLSFNISEDCLYLNVFVPYGNPPPEGFATIIWFHPGNFTTGNPGMWNPHTLIYKQRVIVVTFAWRLNIMGFLTTMDGEAPGNFGLMDQQAAMMWVKSNIQIFGGNADNICLMGYGTGAMSIAIHMINPQSKGLFHKVISMSGNFMNSAAVKNPAEDKTVLDDLAASFACYRTPTSSLMECLRRLDGASLVSHTSYVNWRPVIDLGLSNSSEPFLRESPRAHFERGDFNKVPVLTGYTNMEDILSIDGLNDEIEDEKILTVLNEIVNRDLPVINNTDSCIYNYDHIMDSVMFFYGPSVPLNNTQKARQLIADFNTEKYYGSSTYLHAFITSKDQPTYMYRFDMKPSTEGVTGNIPKWVSVPHLYDLIYIWGIPYWIALPKQEWDLRDKRTSDIIMSFWTNFAKTSDPTEGSIFPIKWDPFTKDDPGILIIDRTFNMSDQTRLNYKSFKFWNEYYPKVIELATQCCNATDSAPIIHRSYSLYTIFLPYIILLFAW
ncbi:PREDICTED: acetylcholinesterase [Nicrophorus vespilloides]|uniref:Acetylcholinesterase n=1 Tax=Nicrophorus vespilloides TaxID=110193 RepID=A0ABM1MCT8_NICVS|nr:PREDICTED: acetylcholinesterase [Nicrophorus vespilloides]